MGQRTDRAKRAIQETLSVLSFCATEEECREALDLANPFSTREGHDLRVWEREREEALALRFKERRKEGAKKKPRFTLGPRHVGDTWLWLSVECHWCKELKIPACIACAGMWGKLNAVVDLEIFRTLRHVAEREEAALAALLDWLCDHDIVVEGEAADRAQALLAGKEKQG